ncbi:MAG: NAD(P)-dependent oxidoreductase, partial [Prevotella sp.]|nr:NAD(P)-dependent oxidoreductase [Prevotella sp.]
TGVYGPREKDYFLMAQSIKNHVDFAAGFRRQDITFVYVLDVVQAVFLALDRGKDGRKYFLSDGNVYQSADFSHLIRQYLGRPWCLRVVAPLWVLRFITRVGEIYGRLTGRITALNNDKYHILKQRNWRCNIEPAVDELGYHPQYNLQQGTQETIAWYQQHHWL